MPVGSLMRGRHGPVPEYPHLGLGNLTFVSPDRLAESWRLLATSSTVSTATAATATPSPTPEPQLGRRGLLSRGGGTDIPDLQLAPVVLNLSDGAHGLLEIANARACPSRPSRGATILEQHGLLASA